MSVIRVTSNNGTVAKIVEAEPRAFKVTGNSRGPAGPAGPQGIQGPAGNNAPSDHTLLSNIGTNTHAQIDTHIASVSNPHSVTAAQVGNTTAQWNASKLQGRDLISTAPTNGQAIIWNDSLSRWEPTTIITGGSVVDDTLTDTTHTWSSSKINTLLNGKVAANGAITGATKTKITYDAKGLVTAGADATTSDIAEGTNLYYTDVRVRANRLDQLTAPTASVSLGSQKITNLLDPTLTQDAASKNYVDTQITSFTTPDATSSVKGKLQLTGDLGGTAASPTVPGLSTKEPTITAGTTSQYWRGDKSWQTLNKSAVGLANVDNTSDVNKPVSTAVQNALNQKTVITVGTSAGADYVATGTSDEVTIQNATNNLPAGRSSVATVYLKGNFTVGASITVPSYTHVILDGKITLDSSWTLSSGLTGVFVIGSVGQTIKQVEIEGGAYYGAYFSSFPTVGTTNNRICGIHSVATILDSKFHDFYTENVFSPITLEKLGGSSTTPSDKVNIDRVHFKDAAVGVQTYGNGYKYQGLQVTHISAENCIDDVVAIVGGWGGVVGGTATFQDVIVNNISAQKNGTTGAVVKLDGGDLNGSGGKGVIKNVTVTNVSGRTTGTSEGLVDLFNGGNASSSHIALGELQGADNFTYGVWLQTSGVDIQVDDFHLQALYGIFVQSTSNPGNSQALTIENGTIDSRTNTVEGDGIVYAAGTGTQGIQNVKVVGVDINNKLRPINEGSTVPTGVQGTYSNTFYDIDVRNSATTDCVFSSTNRTIRFYRQGQYQNESAPTFSAALGVPSGGTGVTTLTGLVKATGTSAFTAATAGTDYSAGTSGLATGILKSTTGTGVLSIAAAADFPTLDQIPVPTAALNLNGQTLNGNSTASGTLTLASTSNATKGKILFGTSAYDEVNNRLGIGTASPGSIVDVSTNTNATIQLKTSLGSLNFLVDRGGNTSYASTVYKTAGSVNWATGLQNEATGYFFIGTSQDASVTPKLSITTGGNVGLGLTGATAVLHLKAGTATANTAPLKFSAGTNLTAAEAGAMEWDGTNLFISQTTGPTRKTLAYTDSNITGTAANVTGVVALANGGTNANLTASNGGIFYSTASAGAVLAGTATAGQVLRSGASAAPSWSTSTYPATNAAGDLVYGSAANTLATLALGTAGQILAVNSGGTAPAWQNQTPETALMFPQAICAPINTTAVTAAATGVTYFLYLGKAMSALTTCTVRTNVTTGVATITWAEVGIFKGAFVHAGTTTMTRLGFTDVSTTFNTTGLKTTTVSLSGVAVGDDLWVCYGSSATTPFQIRGTVADEQQSGVVQSITGRPSTIAAATASTLGGATLVPGWLTVKI